MDRANRYWVPVAGGGCTETHRPVLALWPASVPGGCRAPPPAGAAGQERSVPRQGHCLNPAGGAGVKTASRVCGCIPSCTPGSKALLQNSVSFASALWSLLGQLQNLEPFSLTGLTVTMLKSKCQHSRQSMTVHVSVAVSGLKSCQCPRQAWWFTRVQQQICNLSLSKCFAISPSMNTWKQVLSENSWAIVNRDEGTEFSS